MRTSLYLARALTLASMVVPAAAEEGDALGVGQAAWYEHCTVCHGRDGSGGGPFVPLLRTPPPDLTALARDNGGVFPRERVLRAIDGRDIPPAHGAAEMPLWGKVLSEAGECEARVRSRVVDVTAWLRTLQR